MKILVACEESQAVTNEFRKLGHEAYSCDIMPTSGEHPEWHLQQDVVPLLEENWDMIIAFPPCTHLAVSGARHFAEKIADGRQKQAIDFFMMFAMHPCKKIVIENPVGIMSSIWKKPSQIINPYQFGDRFKKKTCLWIKGLPNLIETDVVNPEEDFVYPNGKRYPQWMMDALSKSPTERAKLRSKTFPGIAKAMAVQWGNEGIIDYKNKQMSIFEMNE